jgi:hypothetical protein
MDCEFASGGRGEQRLDGSPADVKTGEEQIRANYTQYIAPTWQGFITLTHDMSASGRLKQDFGLILGVAKMFQLDALALQPIG